MLVLKVKTALGSIRTSLPAVRTFATEVDLPSPINSSKNASFKKGTGGRCSFSGNVVTVFGSTGFLGLHVVNRLAKEGNQLIIPYRQDPYYVRHLKVVGELGQVLFLPFDLKDEETIRRSIKYSSVVINLIGTRKATRNYSFADVHVDGARRIARLSREMGVQRLIHVSAMGATKTPKPGIMRNGSEILRTKAYGEDVVRDEFPEATIVRPSVMYGENDSFICKYLSRFRKIPPFDFVWLYKAGEKTYKMPIFVGDVAAGIDKILMDPTSIGKTYEFVGPHCYKLSELIDYIYEKARCIKKYGYFYYRHGVPLFLNLPMMAMIAGCELTSKIFKVDTALMREWIEVVECNSDILTGVPTLTDLGIRRLAEFELVGGNIALSRPFSGYYQASFGEIDPPPLPLRSQPIYATKKPVSGIVTEEKSFAIN